MGEGVWARRDGTGRVAWSSFAEVCRGLARRVMGPGREEALAVVAAKRGERWWRHFEVSQGARPWRRARRVLGLAGQRMRVAMAGVGGCWRMEWGGGRWALKEEGGRVTVVVVSSA